MYPQTAGFPALRQNPHMASKSFRVIVYVPTFNDHDSITGHRTHTVAYCRDLMSACRAYDRITGPLDEYDQYDVSYTIVTPNGTVLDLWRDLEVNSHYKGPEDRCVHGYTDFHPYAHEAGCTCFPPF